MAGNAAGSCETPTPADPCTIVVLGASGDLAARKLIPALFHLFRNRGLPPVFRIVGCGRTAWSETEFRNRMKSAAGVADAASASDWERFGANLFYRAVDYADEPSVSRLADGLRSMDRDALTGGNRIFYLALPPVLYRPVARNLGKAGLSLERRQGNGWARIVLEKPFGSDLATSRELDEELHRHFREHQVFRMDHYLAKETVQNILMFRFANGVFEPIWNRRYIDYISIRAEESLGVEHRAGYYESAGVLRDMFQNHMLQLLSMTAMEPPPRFQAYLVRDEKAKVFSALRPFPVDAIEEHLVLGQYAAGVIEDRPVPGYRAEAGVAPDSLTPTFAAMKVFLDNWRWQGVPFYLISGKRLARKRTEIVIQFKPVPLAMFRHTLDAPISANRLVLGIYPDENITLSFQTKQPGATVCLRTVAMDFHYNRGFSEVALDAYEKALLDCLLGDHMLFWRQDAVDLSWTFLSPVIAECEQCAVRGSRLRFYPAGSSGPPDIHPGPALPAAGPPVGPSNSG
jgi:glucose-6-phosphate 1-dehydrogenase